MGIPSLIHVIRACTQTSLIIMKDFFISYIKKFRFSEVLWYGTQGWISYMGTQIPMFVHKLGSIKSGQTCLSSTMGFFMEVLLWFSLHFWETSRLYLKCGLFRTFGFRSIIMGFFSYPRRTHLTTL